MKNDAKKKVRNIKEKPFLQRISKNHLTDFDEAILHYFILE